MSTTPETQNTPSVPTRPVGLEWPQLPAKQQPSWPDDGSLERVRETLATYPPLVFAGECDDLRTRLAAASRGEAFVLQGGDCAEMFASATADNIRDLSLIHISEPTRPY